MTRDIWRQKCANDHFWECECVGRGGGGRGCSQSSYWWRALLPIKHFISHNWHLRYAYLLRVIGCLQIYDKDTRKPWWTLANWVQIGTKPLSDHFPVCKSVIHSHSHSQLQPSNIWSPTPLCVVKTHNEWKLLNKSTLYLVKGNVPLRASEIRWNCVNFRTSECMVQNRL